MQAYAKQAKNRTMEIDAAEIRIRAERRLGELIIAQKETVGLNKGGAGIGKPKSAVPEEYHTQPPTLAEAGIDKKLSARSQKTAAVPDEYFEEKVDVWRNEMEKGAERVTTGNRWLYKKHHPSPQIRRPQRDNRFSGIQGA